MDGEKFDDLIRRLTAIRLNRGSALRGMVAGVAAAVTGASLAKDEADAKKKHRKGGHAAHAQGKKGKRNKHKSKSRAEGVVTTTTKTPPTTTTTKTPPTTTTTKAPHTTTTTKAPHTTTTTRPPFCGHSTGPNGGCMGSCTSAGFTGRQCGVICGNGQFTGACPVGQGGGNPCCNAGYCTPSNFVAGSNGNPVYVGPTSGCA